VRILLVTLFRRLAPASDSYLKVLPKAGHECTLEKIDQRQSERNLMHLSEQSLEIVPVSVSKETSRMFISTFLNKRQANN
jgi:hypothetical protein